MYPPSMARPAASKSENIDYTKRYSELYFGYASNLAPSSIKGRCPDSLFCGLARLEDYKWQINDTGFGNIVPSKGDHVYGALVFLSPRDEAGLDESEGVPWLYQKHSLEVERIDSDGSASGQKVQVMTYVDVERTEDGVIDRGYVVWIVKATRTAHFVAGCLSGKAVTHEGIVQSSWRIAALRRSMVSSGPRTGADVKDLMFVVRTTTANRHSHSLPEATSWKDDDSAVTSHQLLSHATDLTNLRDGCGNLEVSFKPE